MRALLERSATSLPTVFPVASVEPAKGESVLEERTRVAAVVPSLLRVASVALGRRWAATPALEATPPEALEVAGEGTSSRPSSWAPTFR